MAFVAKDDTTHTHTLLINGPTRAASDCWHKRAKSLASIFAEMRLGIMDIWPMCGSWVIYAQKTFRYIWIEHILRRTKQFTQKRVEHMHRPRSLCVCVCNVAIIIKCVCCAQSRSFMSLHIWLSEQLPPNQRFKVMASILFMAHGLDVRMHACIRH